MQFSTDPKLVRPPKLSEQVAQFLSDEITKGPFKAGENLPSEAELASQFNVSRTIIREALARLEFEGIVESRRGSKTKIAPSHQKRIFRIGRIEQMDSYGLKQLYEFRAVLECATAAFAAKRRSKEDLAKIEACLNVLFETTRIGQPNLDANVEFHQLIAAASHNHYLIDFMQFLNGQIWEQIRGDQELRDQIKEKEAVLETHREHRAIFNAIARGDHQKAEEAIWEHISIAAKRRNITLDL